MGPRAIVVSLLLLACTSAPALDAGQTDAGEPDAAEHDAGPTVFDPVALAVYSEFLTYPEVEATLTALGTRDAALAVAVPNDRIGDAGLASLLRAAEAAGVEVHLWFLLPLEDGYWPNEENIDVFASEVMRLLDWIAAEGLVAAAVVYDLEPAFEYSEVLRAGLASGTFDEVEALMRTHMDEASYLAARDTLAAHVRAVQARGLRANAVTYPQVLDDLGDGDHDLQDALDIPVEGVPFDSVSFMVYQTTFAEAGTGWIGPGLIRSYAADANRHFGERATIALGLVGNAGIFDHTGAIYDEPASLAEDIAAARAEGVNRVEVYSLDGMVELGLETWLTGTDAAPARASIPSAALIARGAAFSLDENLDE